MARKGVYVSEPSDCSLTETVLIQTGPLKMSAHMAVIEAMMNLFVKELVGSTKIMECVKRISKNAPLPEEPETPLLLWINQCCQALRVKLEDEKGETVQELPKFSKLQTISELSNGIGLAAVCALYCPSDFSWTEISYGGAASSADSLSNIQLIKKLFSELFSYNIFHLTVEDVFYMHNSINLTMECMIVDLFTLLECVPNVSVKLPGVEEENIIHIADTSSSNVEKYSDDDDGFIVKKGRSIPTLSSVAKSYRSLSPNLESGQKEKLNQDTKSEERGETETPVVSTGGLPRGMVPAGRPSERLDRERSYAGRRSRRNSTDDNQSQISLENIGGSMENISVLGRNPDKELKVHTGRRFETNVSVQRKGSANQQTFDVRRESSERNFNGDDSMFLDNKDYDAMEKLDTGVQVAASSPKVSKDDSNRERKTSFADLRRKSQNLNQFATSGIHITYTEGDGKENISNSRQQENKFVPPVEKTNDTNSNSSTVNDKLNSVRMKLEERRKRIEEEKKKMDSVMAKQRDTSDSQKNSNMFNDNKPYHYQQEPDRGYRHMPVNSEKQEQANPYNKTVIDMNEHMSELSNNIQRLAAQQTQIQQMMQRPPTTAYTRNGMEPQPFYMSTIEQPPAPQRRTWGQPQPITFPSSVGPGGMMLDRPGWAGNPNPYEPPSQYHQYDQYNSPVVHRDQWGNYMPAPGSMYPPGGPGYPPMYGQQYSQPPYSPHAAAAAAQYPSPQYAPNYSPQSKTNITSPIQPPQPTNLPFRLHDSPGSVKDLSKPEAPNSTHVGHNEDIDRNGKPVTSTPVRKLHAPVPAPPADDMAPQNISFIENSSDAEEKMPGPQKIYKLDNDEEDDEENLTEKFSRLSMPTGDKTYRVKLHADGREPTSLATDPALSNSGPRSTSRTTISSSFKERRRGSNESGPPSINNSNSLPPNNAIQSKLTDEEVETLNNMKTEILDESRDPAKGFVISFDDEPNVKPKPVLKERKFSKRISKEEINPDPVMIMLDMNEDIDSDHRDNSPIRKPLKSYGNESKFGGDTKWNSYHRDDVDSSIKSPKTSLVPEPVLPAEPVNEVHDTSDTDSNKATRLIIGDQSFSEDTTPSDMAKKKEKIIMQSLRRKQMAEEKRLRREEENRIKKEEEAWKAEEVQRKKEEDARRKEAILEQYKLKKEQEKAEEEGRHFPSPVSAKPIPKIKNDGSGRKQRPKTMHMGGNDKRYRGSNSNLSSMGSNVDLRRSESRGSLVDPYDRPQSNRSTMSLAGMGSARSGNKKDFKKSNPYLNEEPSPRMSRTDRGSRSASQPRGKRDSSVSSGYGGLRNNDSLRGSRDSLISRRTYTARRGSNASLYEDDDDYYYGGSLKDLNYSGHKGRRKSSSVSYLGPGSLPSRQRRGGGDFDDAASDISSTASGWSAYGYRSGGGSRLGLYKEPSVKSNRPIVMNAIEHVVFPGVVNRDTRFRVLEEIDACDCPHFLILFRDSKCQFRGLYAYYPDTEEVFKIYGTGPKQISEKMFEHYYKYNSGGKKFTQIHTKSLTVTIDAFTIHNSLWLGKKSRLPDKRGMPLAI